MRAWLWLLLVGCAPAIDERPDFDGDGIPDVEDDDADGDGIPDVEDDFVDLDSDGFDRGIDCDDADAEVNPDAEEICGNGKDDNCDGGAPGCRLEGEVPFREEAAASVRGDQSTDALGSAVVLLGDADDDGFSDVLVGAGNVGQAWRFSGLQRGRLSAGMAVETYTGDGPGYARSISGGGDLTGDGRIDVVIGDPQFSSGTRNAVGRVDIRGVQSESGRSVVGRAAADTIGQTAHVLEDVDQNGRADLWTTVQGAPALIDLSGDQEALSTVLEIRPRLPGDRLTLPAAGDFDGDGVPDLLVQDNARQGWLFLSPGQGVLGAADADSTQVGGEPDRNGFTPTFAVDFADLDGDGYDDAIVEQGLIGFDDQLGGGVRFLAGGVDVELTGSTGGLAPGEAEKPAVWGGLTQTGDLDQDGRADLLLGLDSGGVALYYDVSPNERGVVEDWDAVFGATLENPVRSLDVAPAPNQDGTVSLGFGFPIEAGQVIIYEVSSL